MVERWAVTGLTLRVYSEPLCPLASAMFLIGGERKVPAFEITSFQHSCLLRRNADPELLKLARDKSGNKINSLIPLLPKCLKQLRFIG